MVTVLILVDFTEDGVSYYQGDTVTVPQQKCDEWIRKGWCNPTGDGN